MNNAWHKLQWQYQRFNYKNIFHFHTSFRSWPDQIRKLKEKTLPSRVTHSGVLWTHGTGIGMWLSDCPQEAYRTQTVKEIPRDGASGEVKAVGCGGVSRHGKIPSRRNQDAKTSVLCFQWCYRLSYHPWLKQLPCPGHRAQDLVSILGPGKSPEENSSPLQ